MHTLWHWLLHLLCWASADPGLLEHERARCAGAVAVSYAALAQEPAPAPRRDESRNEQPKLGSELGKKNAHVSPTPPLPPAAPCLQCSGTGRIYRSDGGWVRCPCQCPDGRCPKKK